MGLFLEDSHYESGGAGDVQETVDHRLLVVQYLRTHLLIDIVLWNIPPNYLW